MFGIHVYQYGDKRRHLVVLTEIMAHAVNNIKFVADPRYPNDPTRVIFENPDEVSLAAYNRAAGILNKYLKVYHNVTWKNESVPLLRRIR